MDNNIHEQIDAELARIAEMELALEIMRRKLQFIDGLAGRVNRDLGELEMIGGPDEAKVPENITTPQHYVR